MIRKLNTGQYRLYSRKRDPRTGKRKNLGTFSTLAAAQRHERAVSTSSDISRTAGIRPPPRVARKVA